MKLVGPHLGAVLAEVGGDRVHGPLHHEAALRPAGAAVGRDHHGVGVEALEDHPVGARLVGAEQLGRGDDRDDQAVRRVGAVVVPELHVEARAPGRRRRSRPRRGGPGPARGREEMKCSRRSSVNFTGRPSARAASGTSSSSGHGWLILTPNPPPTSGVMTSTWPRSRPSLAATQPRTPVEVWVERPHRHPAGVGVPAGDDAAALHRLAGAPLDGEVERERCAARRRSRPRASPLACSIRAPTLPGTSSWTRWSARPGGVDADDRLQELVVDPDPADGVLGDVAVVGDDEGDRLADVVDLVLGQRVLGAAVGQRRVRDQQRQRLGHRRGRGRRRSRPRGRPRRRARR